MVSLGLEQKLIAVPVAALRDEIANILKATIKGLSQDIVDQIEHFFVSYNAIAGKEFKMLRLSGPAPAKRLIEKGARRFTERSNGEPKRSS